MGLHVQCVLAALAVCCAWSAAQLVTSEQESTALAFTDTGCVCGGYQPGDDFAYFLGVPYAKQPRGALRFKELQPLDPWKGCRPAKEVGPVCPQDDLFYGPLINTTQQSEECIHANIYVPLEALPTRARGKKRPLLPVLVAIHGGGFIFGSSNPDFHGPEYLVKKDVVVITFNYRIGVFGFLSLNTSSIPGNAGLRDMVTLLRWVKRNAAAFGGDPRDVTLAGQSASAAAVHILSLSQPCLSEGLFKRAILMSGSATRGFSTTTPAYAETISKLFLSYLGINSTDPEEIHQELTTLPLEQIMEAQKQCQDYTGLLSFTPVVESEHPGVERILDDDPDVLQAQGRGKDIPFLIGFTNKECESFRPRFDEIDIVQRIQNTSALILPLEVIYTTPPTELSSKILSIQEEYFSQSLDMDSFIRLCTDTYFIYPSLRMAKLRAANQGARVFLYRFAYNADYSVFKKERKLDYIGASHAEDLTYVLRPNLALRNTTLSAEDSDMVDEMTTYVTDFMRYGQPTTNIDDWRPAPLSAEGKDTYAPYKNIINYQESYQWPYYQRMVKFFDSIYESSR